MSPRTVAAIGLSLLACASGAVSTGCDGDCGAFTEWLAEAGAKTHGLELKSSPSQGWHVIASADAEPGATLAEIPLSLVLAGDGRHGGAALDGSGMEDYAPEYDLMLRVLQERRRGSKHLAVLPQVGSDFRTGLWWDDEDAACASPHARAQQEFQYKQFNAFAEAAQAATGASADELKWAYSIVMTRAIRSKGKAILAPFVDMFNHASGQTAHSVRVSITERGMVVTAGPLGAKAGVEMHLSYGDHLTPAKLLVYYGFADSSFDRLYSHVEFPEEPDIPALRKAGCYDRDNLWVSAFEPVSQKLQECVTIAVLPGEQRDAYPDMTPEEKKALLEERRYDVLQVISNHLQQVLGTYPHKWDAACDSSHHLVPMIRESNTHVRKMFLDVKDRIDEEVTRSGARRIVTTQQQDAKRERGRKRKDKPATSDERDPYANSEAFGRWMQQHKAEKARREAERREDELKELLENQEDEEEE
eukprot:TRINITY_DN12292_c0_g1_i1.p1 TRINITY_DN12292_c0_g1~~TRINITY_DN12292_c0_g1_i1.p1  ORF type:complete len:474 (+),score=147.06 TRINITY_DN12292_c0_g1_i1:92-1513(+)